MRESLDDLTVEEAKATDGILDQLVQADASLSTEVDEALTYLKRTLIHFGAEGEEIIEQLLERHLFPLAKLRQDEAGSLLKRVRVAARRQRLTLQEEALYVCSRYEGAGRVLDAHSETTDQLYKELRDELVWPS